MGEEFATLGRVASVMLNLWLYLPYVAALRSGRARPRPATWCIWSALTAEMIVVQAALGAWDEVWYPAAQFAGCTCVAIMAVRRERWRLRRSELLGALIALAGVLAWTFSGTPTLAITAIIAAFATGSLLTLTKTWSDPDSETPGMWTTGAVAAACALLAATSDPASFAYPLYLVVANSAIAIAATRPRRHRVH